MPFLKPGPDFFIWPNDVQKTIPAQAPLQHGEIIFVELGKSAGIAGYVTTPTAYGTDRLFKRVPISITVHAGDVEVR